MKSLLVVALTIICTSCTTLENRRDLYRAPGEGYEQNFPYPPPTRLPNSAPGAQAAVIDPKAPQERHGVITFPEEPGLPEGH